MVQPSDEHYGKLTHRWWRFALSQVPFQSTAASFGLWRRNVVAAIGGLPRSSAASVERFSGRRIHRT